MLHVLSVCTTCCVLSGVFAQSLKPVKLLSQQLSTLLLLRDRRIVALPMLNRFAQLFPTFLGPRKRITHGLQSTKVLRVMSFPRCTAGPNIVRTCCVQNGRNNFQHCWPNNVGSCFVRLHVASSFRTANIDPIEPALLDIFSHLKVGTH